MNNSNERKAELINIQLIATIGFIISIAISFLLAYDDKLKLENKTKLFEEEFAQKLETFQSVLLFIVALVFLYVSYNQYKIAKYEDMNNDSAFDLLLRTDTSVLSLISAIVGLYILYRNYKGNLTISEIENI